MVAIARQLSEWTTAWVRARGLPAAPSLVRGAFAFARIDRAFAFLERHEHVAGLALVEAAIEHFGWRYTIDPLERERIPETGPVVLAANHPLGAVDAFVLLHCIGAVRPDVRIVANDWLARIPGLAPLLLPLRVFGGGARRAELAAIEAALAECRAVVMFPAGEVSRLGLGGIADRRWSDGFVRLAARAGAPVVPVHVGARNSAMFYLGSMLDRAVGTALLPREAFARRRRRVEIRFGAAIDPAHALGAEPATARTVAASLRREVYAIATRREARDRVVPIAHARDRRAIAAAVHALPCLGAAPDGSTIHAGHLTYDSPLLAELARVRELAFRATGEGTGRRDDRDRYDGWYDHIVLWNGRDAEVVGAYRAAPCAEVLAARGIEGLYTHAFFELGDALRARLPAALELGRSFVQPRYWSGRALDHLWYGVGAYLAARPGIRWLFGPVSISAALPAAARDALVAYCRRWHAAEADGTHARVPYADGAPERAPAAPNAGDALRVLRHNLKALGTAMPALLRHYVELCEPGGVRFHAFGVDHDFGGCIDGLVEVDLARIVPRKRERYLGTRAATAVRLPCA